MRPIVTREMILKLIGPEPIPPQLPAANNGMHRSNGNGHGAFDPESWIAKFLPAAKEPVPWGGGRKWSIGSCPFDGDHTGESSFVGQMASGAMVFRCLHNSCRGHDWKELRAMLDPDYAEKKRTVKARNERILKSKSEDDGKASVLMTGAHHTDQGEYIEIGNDQFARSVIEALPEGSLFLRGSIAGDIVGEPGDRSFIQLKNDGVRIKTDQHVRLTKWVTKGAGASAKQVSVYVPTDRDSAGLILSAASVSSVLPNVRGIAAYPIYDRNFRLVDPGLHDGIFYDQPEELKDLIPEMDTGIIRSILDDFIFDFPFKNEASRQNFFGLLLTLMLQYACGGNRPLHLVVASLERTGKSKLIEVGLGLVMLGKQMSSEQLGRDEAEVEKRITSTLLACRSVVNYDNFKESIDSPSLASLLTSAVWTGRLLGASQMATLWNGLTCIGSGNNVHGTGEIVKRIVPIELQPLDDAPENRTGFVHEDFAGFARENRRRILSCLIGAVELWKQAGQPRGSAVLGGFESWASAVGGVLSNLGYTAWLSNAEAWRRTNNTRGDDLRALVAEWHREHGRAEVSPATLMGIAERLDLFPGLRAGKSERSLLTSFGMRVLARNTDTPVLRFIIRRNSKSRPTTYFLEEGTK